MDLHHLTFGSARGILAVSAGGWLLWSLLGILLVLMVLFLCWRSILASLRQTLRWLLDKCESLGTVPPKRKRRPGMEDTIAVGMVWVICILAGTLLVYHAVGRLDSPPNVHGAVSGAMLWAMSCLVVGSFLGFLFGVPYVVQNDPAATTGAADGKKDARTASVRYRSNTALEQVSEWLTKMLVGVGLVQLRKIPGYLDSAAAAMSQGYGNSTGSHAFGIAVIVYFTFVGFMGSYLMTKLYLQAALLRSDASTLGNAPSQANMTAEEVIALRDGAIGFSQRDRSLTGLAAVAAAKLLREVSFDELEDPQDYALWAKAKLNAGEFIESINAYREACRLAPADVALKLEYATALYLQERRRRKEADSTPAGQTPAKADEAEMSKRADAAQCVRAQLVEAYQGLYPGVSSDLRRSVFKDLTYVYLFPDQTPTDYERAIRYGQEYQLDRRHVPSGGLCVNLACAYGQRAQRLNTIKVRLGEIDRLLNQGQGAGTGQDALNDEKARLSREKTSLDGAFPDTRKQALGNIKEALRIDRTWLSLLQRLLNGDDPNNDDLIAFREDAEFRTVLEMEPLPAPAAS